MAKGVEFKKRDIRKETPSKEEIAAYYKKSGLPVKKFIRSENLLLKRRAEFHEIVSI